MTRYLYRKAVGRKLFDNIETKSDDQSTPKPTGGNGDEKMSTAKE
jgi:hypothetical protein